MEIHLSSLFTIYHGHGFSLWGPAPHLLPNTIAGCLVAALLKTILNGYTAKDDEFGHFSYIQTMNFDLKLLSGLICNISK